MNWHEYVSKTGRLPEWPYEVNYGKENVIESDVLVVGGGVAGCRAAIEARKQGATVAVMDRGFSKHSGNGGAGVDHWHGAVTNPCSKVTPEMYSEAAMICSGGYTNGSARYIIGKEGWDTLLELEEWGMQIRDLDDEFKDTMFRDEETKLLFAYDVENKHCLRVYGHNVKPIVDAEMRRLGCDVYDRVCVTSLLTEGGKQGARVIGATGVNDRTGEFYIFKAKAVVVSTGITGRLWYFAPELINDATMYNLNQTAAGHTIAWNAGAEMVMMEQNSPRPLAGMGYAPYSTGNTDNTYQGVPAVDNEGKLIKYENSHGELIDEEHDIFAAADPDKFVIGHGINLSMVNGKEYSVTNMDRHIGEKIRKGEYKLPLYNDWTLLPPKHRRLVFGMMLSQEGKCRVPIYYNLTKWGFDPDQDMLQYPVDTPEGYAQGAAWVSSRSHNPPNWGGMGVGGILSDWRLQATIPGLFAAGGNTLFGSGCHGEAQTTGRYCGRQAAAFAKTHPAVEPDAEQIRKEKERCYAPVTREQQGDVGWKEMNYALARLMQDYCGFEVKTETTLEMGIRRLNDLRDTEGERTYASNPHELVRLLEVFSLIDLGKLIMESCRARKASSDLLGFKRLDYPEVDPPEWDCFVSMWQENGEVCSRKVSKRYYLEAPYADNLEENYRRYAELDSKEGK